MKTPHPTQQPRVRSSLRAIERGALTAATGGTSVGNPKIGEAKTTYNVSEAG